MDLFQDFTGRSQRFSEHGFAVGNCVGHWVEVVYWQTEVVSEDAVTPADAQGSAGRALSDGWQKRGNLYYCPTSTRIHGLIGRSMIVQGLSQNQ